MKDIERSTNEITMEEAMIDIVDQYICLNDAMGLAKCVSSSEKQMAVKKARRKVTSQREFCIEGCAEACVSDLQNGT
jgi:hypothetical protein